MKQPEKKRIIVFDTTLRDGEQSPGNSMNIEEKLRIAEQLQRLNVDVIEAGFPIASDGDFEAVKQIAQTIKGPQIAGLARSNVKDIDRAWEALQYAGNRGRIHTFIATSPVHMQYKLKMEPAKVLETAAKMVAYARTLTQNIEFSCEDAVRSELPFMLEVVQAVVEAGATTINIPDTVGYTMPFEYYNIIKAVVEMVPEHVVVSAHCHNDLGMAVANSIYAVRAGARQVECTLNGIGERAGNCSLEELVMSLRTRHDILPYSTGIVTELLTPTSRLLSHITGIMVQPNKAIVGANAFAHESGIHQHGVLMEKSTYEIMTPDSVGLKDNLLVMGKHSGTHAFRDKLKTLGHSCDDDEMKKLFNKFKALADLKKEIFDEDIEAMIMDAKQLNNKRFKLNHLTVTCGSFGVATATVQMLVDEKQVRTAEIGDGPVDAVYKAINKLAKMKPKLVSYNSGSIGGGTDAQGDVTVKLSNGKDTVIGRGTSPDTINASAKAYVDGLNRLAQKSEKPIETF